MTLMFKKFSCFGLSSLEMKRIIKLTTKNTVNLLWILVFGPKIRKELRKQMRCCFQQLAARQKS